MRKKTLRLVYPEWHGGVNSNYVFGSRLLAHIAPPSNTDEIVQIEVATDFDAPVAAVDGVDFGGVILNTIKQTRDVLNKKNPDRVIVFGGDCSVSQVPFDYLSGKYGDTMGILWFDAHPDMANVQYTSHFHEMTLSNLLGQNPQSELTKTYHPVAKERVLLAGLIEERLRPLDMACKNLNLKIASPEELQKSSSSIHEWIQLEGIRYLAVHWDLDVLSPVDFRSIYPAEPYTNPEEFPAAVGRMRLQEVKRVLKDASEVAEIVGLSITEHLPWDAFNLRKTLSEISIFEP